MMMMWRRALALLLAGVLVGAGVAAAPPAARANTANLLEIAPGKSPLTGVIEVRVQVATGVERYSVTIQMGRPDSQTYYTPQTLFSARTADLGPTARYQWETDRQMDGYWTVRLMVVRTGETKATEVAQQIVLLDNRWGLPQTEPGKAFGAIKTAVAATGTVAVNVTVDSNAVDWVLWKQAATSVGTDSWTKLHASGLRQDTYHWYTRSDNDGAYTLRLEVRDADKHRQYLTTTVNVDNRFGVPQTEPGTARAAWQVPEIVSGGLPTPLTFTGTVSAWRVQSLSLNGTASRQSVASGQGGAPVTPVWDTTKVSDGSYLLILEVEDQNKHIVQSMTTTTVANKITSVLKQQIAPLEEHQWVLAVAGGLTGFRLNASQFGYFQVTARDAAGAVAGTARLYPGAIPLQLDLPGGTYTLSVRALFTLPGTEYTVEMQGATAHTIPLARLTTNLPLSLRKVASVPVLVAAQSPRPAAADWSVDGGPGISIANPDGTVDIDTQPLADGLHTLTLRARNPVGFVTLANFPVVVDNQASFTDVGDADLSRFAVELLYDIGATRGYPDGTFRTAAQITRAEFAKMLSTVAGLDVSAPYSGAFRDVVAAQWYAPYVEAVYKAGLIKGSQAADGSWLFRPNDPVSRAELMVVALRAANVPEALAAMATKTLTAADWRNVPDWARASVYLGSKAGLLAERDGGLLKPTESAQRGEVALALARLVLGGHIGAR